MGTMFICSIKHFSRGWIVVDDLFSGRIVNVLWVVALLYRNDHQQQFYDHPGFCLFMSGQVYPSYAVYVQVSAGLCMSTSSCMPNSNISSHPRITKPYKKAIYAPFESRHKN